MSQAGVAAVSTTDAWHTPTAAPVGMLQLPARQSAREPSASVPHDMPSPTSAIGMQVFAPAAPAQ